METSAIGSGASERCCSSRSSTFPLPPPGEFAMGYMARRSAWRKSDMSVWYASSAPNSTTSDAIRLTCLCVRVYKCAYDCVRVFV